MDVHPVADLFPMLADDELKELAADIAERGLLQPIVQDAAGRVLDGRNRLAACELAGIEPEFITYDGDDPEGYALAANGQRRDLTKSKRAVIAAQANSLVPKEFGGQARLARLLKVSEALISQATTTIKHASDLVDLVVSGAQSLDSAYETARKNKKAAETTEGQMLRLRENRPDLADQVADERLTLAAATAAMEADVKEEERQRRVATELLCQHIVSLSQMNDTADRYDPAMTLPGRAITREVLDDARIALDRICDTWKERELP